MRTTFVTFLLLVFASANAQWNAIDSLTHIRQEMPAVELNRKIYVGGGISTSLVTLKSMEIYEIASNAWSPAPDLPLTVHHHSMAVLNGKIYLIGGYENVTFNAVPNVYSFDPDSGKWTRLNDLPFAVSAADAVTYNGKIYLFGGKNNNGVLDATLEYDPVMDWWNTKEFMPTPREHLCVAISGDKAYAIAGRGGSGTDTTVEIYDLVNDTWARGPHLPSGRSGCDAATVRGKIFVFGGEGGGIHNQNEMYDPVTNTWTSKTPMPHPRHGLGAVAVGDTIYTMGGATIEGYGASAICDVFVDTTIIPDTIFLSMRNSPGTDLVLHCWYDAPNRLLQLQLNSELNAELNYQVVNMKGELIYTDTTTATGNIVSIRNTQLPAGFYIVKVLHHGTVVSQKFAVR